jgi:putative protein-disulfide isomerase
MMRPPQTTGLASSKQETDMRWQMKLVLVADPMCSWCYGFGKEMTSLQERHPEMSLEIVVGGLRAGATDILDDAGKRFRLEHWAKVEQASGLPFKP